VDNKHVIAQEEIFGPVLSVIPADSEDNAVDIANDTIYWLNAAVFNPDISRAREVAGQLRPGTVGHNTCVSTSVPRSAGSSSPASAARAVAKASCRAWRPRPFCSTRHHRDTRLESSTHLPVNTGAVATSPSHPWQPRILRI
jgi:acyl-CoA reductase-like NAD-dependent aldehyde dehydrogenase